ncbi:MAG: hypothetical protein VX529_14985 [Pseudomonadota bacterium]|nr:hypothetical protein [Pseudomonadota bacterium]
MEWWDDQKRQQDIDDLNNEMAGRDVGRQHRFLHDRDPQYIEERKREDKHRHDMLMQLMRDAEYAAAYQRAWDALDNAQDALSEALLENAEETERLAEALDAIEGQAARLPDGSPVFRAADGSLRDADGNRLRSDALPASLTIPEDAPSYEEYASARDALHSARTRGQELARIQTEVIDPARDRVEGGGMTPDEIDAITSRLDDVTDALKQGRIPEIDVEAPTPASPSDHNAAIVAPVTLPSLD